MMFLLGDDRQFAYCASPCGQVIGRRSEAKRIHDILRMSREGREDISDIISGGNPYGTSIDL